MDAFQTINVGSAPNDDTGDSLRTAFQKVNTNSNVADPLRWKIGTDTSSATHTIDVDSYNHYFITAQAEDCTFGAPTGTPQDAQKLLIRIKDNGSPRSLSWNAAFRSVCATLPTTTTASKTTYVGLLYNNTDSKWDCMAVGTES